MKKSEKLKKVIEANELLTWSIKYGLYFPGELNITDEVYIENMSNRREIEQARDLLNTVLVDK